MQLKPITAIIVLFIVVASLLVSGCTTTNTTTNTATNTNPANVNVTVKAVQSPQQFNGSEGIALTPRPGNKYVMYNLTFTNINALDTQVSGYFSFALLDVNNNVYSTQQSIQSRYLSNAFPDIYTITQPGDKVSGDMVFEVPQNATLVTLRYHDTNSGFNVTVPL